MHLKSIPKHAERHTCFVYKHVHFVAGPIEPQLEVDIKPRAFSWGIYSGCGKKRPAYDRRSPRRFQFVPLWNMAVFFVYAMRRVDWPSCGVTVERVPWGDGKAHLTISSRWFLTRHAGRLSWQETVGTFGTAWATVCRSVKYAVEWGLAHRNLSGIEAIGCDEVQWRSSRTCLTVIAEQIPAVLHLLDRFHIMRNMNVTIDEVRWAEVSQLGRDGYDPILTKARWCLFKQRENLTDTQEDKLKELLEYNLKKIRAHLLRELFQKFWNYANPAWAETFLDGCVPGPCGAACHR